MCGSNLPFDIRSASETDQRPAELCRDCFQRTSSPRTLPVPAPLTHLVEVAPVGERGSSVSSSDTISLRANVRLQKVRDRWSTWQRVRRIISRVLLAQLMPECESQNTGIIRKLFTFEYLLLRESAVVRTHYKFFFDPKRRGQRYS